MHYDPVPGAGVAPGDTIDKLHRAILRFVRLRIFFRELPGNFVLQFKQFVVHGQSHLDGFEHGSSWSL